MTCRPVRLENLTELKLGQQLSHDNTQDRRRWQCRFELTGVRLSAEEPLELDKWPKPAGEQKLDTPPYVVQEQEYLLETSPPVRRALCAGVSGSAPERLRVSELVSPRSWRVVAHRYLGLV